MGRTLGGPGPVHTPLIYFDPSMAQQLTHAWVASIPRGPQPRAGPGSVISSRDRHATPDVDGCQNAEELLCSRPMAKQEVMYQARWVRLPRCCLLHATYPSVECCGTAWHAQGLLASVPDNGPVAEAQVGTRRLL